VARHWAETLARQHLQALGYRILAENYTLRGAEIDLVAQDGEVLVFIEVRQRASSRFGSAAESVTATKQRRLRRAALHFVYERFKRDDLPMRFDAVLIEGTRASHRLAHLKGAF
jgi:putative endonuclease